MKFKFSWPSKIKKRTTPEISDAKNPAPWFQQMFGAQSESGETVNTHSAMKLTAVYRCISLNAATFAGLPKNIINEADGSKVIDNSIYHLIHFQPNPFMTAYNFWKAVMVHLQTDGNAYAIIQRDGVGNPSKLILVEEPTHVNIYERSGDLFYGIKQQVYPWYDVLHFRGLSMNGLKGMAPIRIAMEAIGLGLSAQKLGGKFFAKGAIQQGIIEYDSDLNDESWANFQKHWEETYSGMKNSFGNIPVLEYGMKWKDISIPLEQAQFILTREFQLQEIARIFGVPPPLVGDLSRAHFANIEHLDMQYAKYSIKDYAKNIETECDVKLFPKEQWGKQGMKCSLEGLLRGDIKTRTAYYRTGIVSGFFTRNEVRRWENLPPIPGLDDILTPLNMVADKETDDAADKDKHQESYKKNGFVKHNEIY